MTSAPTIPKPKPDQESDSWKHRLSFNPTTFRRRLSDKSARWVVTAGGVAIIACVLAIMLFIGAEAVPLLGDPTVDREEALVLREIAGGSRVVLFGTEEYREVGYLVTEDARFLFFSLENGQILNETKLEGAGRITTGIRTLTGSKIFLGTDKGSILPVTPEFSIDFEDDPDNPMRQLRQISPSLQLGEPIPIDPLQGSLAQIASRHTGPEDPEAHLALTTDNRLHYYTRRENDDLLADEEWVETRLDLSDSLTATPTALILDQDLENLYLGTDAGQLIHYRIGEDGSLSEPETFKATVSNLVPITALNFLIGTQSIVVGDGAGNVSVWFQALNSEDGSRELTRVHLLEGHGKPITSIVGSARDRGFLTADTEGKTKLHHATTRQTFFTLEGDPSSVVQVVMGPRANGIYSLHENGSLHRWALDNPHPETNLDTLFGEIWYEGYEEPDHIWQSTGGTDEFEPKLSLVPLIFGTFKGTFYAMLISLPLALLGAIYTSQFMHARIKAIIKPTVEVMAALPSVVLGFVAGLWLAPVMEKIMPGILSMFLAVPIVSLLCMGLWHVVPSRIRNQWKHGSELVFLVPMVLLSMWLCIELSHTLEVWLFNGDFAQWWYTSTDNRFDQRNALVVGFAMGFAVIPIIFTIAEDSLSNVPRHLISGSLALGASRWQTALRVVFPTASPGIFSAIMVGFGRAIGETMIVLMATGNTPIMQWNIFDGFRTLSANIAVEIPEAPEGGTLYRVLFLSAFLLFVLTFAVNTVAEVIRMRMRKRYASL